MQEGTFWTVDLWRKAGGVNRNLKLAGDWDLWRRFAEFEPLYVLDFPLGKFSQSEGRLSADISNYYLEVDRVAPSLRRVETGDRNTYKVWRYIGQSKWNLTVTPAQTGDDKVSDASNAASKKTRLQSFFSTIRTHFQ